MCPPNRADERRRPSPAPGPAAQPWVELLDLLAATDAELLDRHGRWYLAGRQPRWLRRNALVALGNVADPADGRVVAALAAHLRHADPVLRAHAVWAARRLGHDGLAATASDDPDRGGAARAGGGGGRPAAGRLAGGADRAGHGGQGRAPGGREGDGAGAAR